ncbi:MAG: hypothetical protein D6677_09610 [Calditrichaeota bacterium]|nr:MAG: hypothetical protein D6677_09610 [Calditrichota bacterium]
MEHTFHSMGNIELLSSRPVVVFASRQTPTELTALTDDLARALSQKGLTVMSGWQSPLEKRFLKVFLKGGQGAVIWVRASSLEPRMRRYVPEVWWRRDACLMMAPEGASARPTDKDINHRDALILEHATSVLFLSITAGGRLERLGAGLLQKKFPLFIVRHPHNRPWMEQGMLPVLPDEPFTLFTR